MDEQPIDITTYVQQTAQLLNLPLAPEHRPGVVENFSKIAVIATLVMEFPLPDTIVAAPVFEP
ncbi:MAG TPA: DUF4089 domain-containing protein [Waterburya sp.]|jgi:hypothetical protein